jgi:soluble lytic murein transglycosylase-like protein
MGNCFILSSVIIASAAVGTAATVNGPATVTMVVRADARTGRLVRSVAKPAARAPEKGADPQITLPPVTRPFPKAFENLVNRIAERHEVDRDLVHSVIREESNHNPMAISSKGALGLMQLDPATARRFGVLNIFDPAENVEGGVRYLKYLLNHYNGDQRLALAAYNAGEAAVERYGGMPPYPETRSYVYRVGKALNQAKEAKKERAQALVAENDQASEASGGTNPIRAFVDAMGKIYYKTP